jgi:peptidoglycan/xylan/chitin deacetylase (PgdA/CDA1 family)
MRPEGPIDMKIRSVKRLAVIAVIAIASAFSLAATSLPDAMAATAAPAAAEELRCYSKTGNGTACVTVDDGYGRKNQKSILDTLRKHHVKCTFFIVGEALLRKPNYWEQAIEDGHEICYHSMHHENLLQMTDKQIQKDIDDWNAALNEALPGYKSPKLARFPGDNGERSKRVLAVFARNGYTVISWNMHDISNDPKKNAGFIRYAMKKDSILLIHFSPVDAEGLPRYIGYLKSHFTLGLVSDAFPESKPAPEPTATPTPILEWTGWPPYEQTIVHAAGNLP